MKKTVRFSWVTGPEMRTGSDDGAAAKAASADRTNGEAERAASNDQRIWESPVVSPPTRGKVPSLDGRDWDGQWPKFDVHGEKWGSMRRHQKMSWCCSHELKLMCAQM